MKISDNFWMATKNLRSNYVRSILTMLGVIIGVTAVIIMVGLGQGTQEQITKNLTAMGSNLLIVTPAMGNRSRGGSFGSGTSLTNDLVPFIQKCSPDIAGVAPEARAHAIVKVPGNSYSTSIIGCTPDYLIIRNYQLSSGTFFTENDLKSRRRMAVLGSYVAEQLFPGANPVGQEVKIGNLRVRIIGVLQTKGQSGYGNNDDLIMLPLYTVQQRINGNKNLNSIYIQVKTANAMDTVQNQINDTLFQKIKDDTKYNIRNQAEILSTVQQSAQTFTMLLAGIAAVSLLVGGIGIMNIMLVSVTERIKEIGTRKAIGAQKEEILQLFLIEAILLSFVGGLIGIGLGWFGAALMSKFMEMNVLITLPSILVSFGFSILTGLFFGVYPAYKAAGLNPIEALRYE
jgi:putative ABC transport system permease protein